MNILSINIRMTINTFNKIVLGSVAIAYVLTLISKYALSYYQREKVQIMPSKTESALPPPTELEPELSSQSQLESELPTDVPPRAMELLNLIECFTTCTINGKSASINRSIVNNREGLLTFIDYSFRDRQIAKYFGDADAQVLDPDLFIKFIERFYEAILELMTVYDRIYFCNERHELLLAINVGRARDIEWNCAVECEKMTTGVVVNSYLVEDYELKYKRRSMAQIKREDASS